MGEPHRQRSREEGMVAACVPRLESGSSLWVRIHVSLVLHATRRGDGYGDGT